MRCTLLIVLTRLIENLTMTWKGVKNAKELVIAREIDAALL